MHSHNYGSANKSVRNFVTKYRKLFNITHHAYSTMFLCLLESQCPLVILPKITIIKYVVIQLFRTRRFHIQNTRHAK